MSDTKALMHNFIDLFSRLKSDLYEITPNLLAGLIILIFGVLFAFVIKWVIQKSVVWLSFVVPKKYRTKTLFKTSLQTISIGLGRVIFILIIVLTLTSSFDKMGLKVLSSWLQDMAKFIPNIFGAAFILFLGWMLKNLILDVSRRNLERMGGKHSRFLPGALSWGFFVLMGFIALDQIGIDLGYIYAFVLLIVAAPLFAIALSFALGARSSIENILTCFQVNKIISIGDTVVFEGKNVKVENIGPIFITLSYENEVISIKGEDFLKTHIVQKKG